MSLSPLSVLSSPLSHLKSHLSTRPTWFSDVPSISHPIWPPDQAAWSSTWTPTILIIVPTPTLDICLLLSSPSNIQPNTFGHNQDGRRRRSSATVWLLRDFTTGAWCTGTYQGNSIVVFLPSFSSLFDSKLNSEPLTSFVQAKPQYLHNLILKAMQFCLPMYSSTAVVLQCCSSYIWEVLKAGSSRSGFDFLSPCCTWLTWPCWGGPRGNQSSRRGANAIKSLHLCILAYFSCSM